jgi:hypothetical protein
VLPKITIRFLARALPGNTYGTNIAGATIKIYKNRGVVLTSLEDFNVGTRSGEQWPWVATVADIAVWTESGVFGDCFFPGLGDVSNIHLPDVRQDGNVALISYRPARDVLTPSKVAEALDAHLDLDYSTTVALHFPVERFDQVIQVDRWLIGRKGESYIAVWRHGLDQHDCSEAQPNMCEEYYFSNPTRGLRAQVWAVVVGNVDTHGDFNSFVDTVSRGQVKEFKYPNPLAVRWTSYRTTLSVDGKELNATLRGR